MSISFLRNYYWLPEIYFNVNGDGPKMVGNVRENLWVPFRIGMPNQGIFPVKVTIKELLWIF